MSGVELHPGLVVVLDNVRRQRQIELLASALEVLRPFEHTPWCMRHGAWDPRRRSGATRHRTIACRIDHTGRREAALFRVSAGGRRICAAAANRTVGGAHLHRGRSRRKSSFVRRSKRVRSTTRPRCLQRGRRAGLSQSCFVSAVTPARRWRSERDYSTTRDQGFHDLCATQPQHHLPYVDFLYIYRAI